MSCPWSLWGAEGVAMETTAGTWTVAPRRPRIPCEQVRLLTRTRLWPSGQGSGCVSGRLGTQAGWQSPAAARVHVSC